jgi:hypothetical protein
MHGCSRTIERVRGTFGCRWFAIEGWHSACLTDEGRRLILKEAH